MVREQWPARYGTDDSPSATLGRFRQAAASRLRRSLRRSKCDAASDLYLAVTFDRRSAFHLNDIVAFEFDNDNDGVRENGDDIALTGPTSTPGVVQSGADYYRFDNGAANQSDAAGGGTIDVSSVFGVSSTSTVGVFELRHDLNSADDAHDFSISVPPPTTVGMLVQISLEDDPAGVNTYVHSFKPSTTYCHLSIAKKSTSVSCPT